MERFEIITDHGGELVEIRNIADNDTCWCRRSRLQPVGGDQYALITQERAQALRVQYRQNKSGEQAMQGPSRTIRTSTSGGR